MLGNLLKIGAPIVGGLLGRKAGTEQQTQTTSRELDPRMAQFVYGADGQSGFLGDIQNLYRSQIQQGGLNPLQQEGLERQAQFLRSDSYSQPFDYMRNLGMQLMGGGVAANPFTRGANAASGMQAPAIPSFQFQPQQQTSLPIYQPPPPPPAPAPAPAPQVDLQRWMDQYRGQDGLDALAAMQTGSAPRTQGGMEAWSALMSIGQNPLAQALSPGLAFGANLLGGFLADREIDRISKEFASLPGSWGTGSGDGGGMPSAEANSESYGGSKGAGFGSGFGHYQGGEVKKENLLPIKPNAYDDGIGGLQAGEYVVKRKVAKRIGKPKMDALNEGRARVVVRGGKA